MKKIMMLAIILVAGLIIMPNVYAQTITVGDTGNGTDLNSKITNLNDNDIIELQGDVTVSTPIEITKKVTIKGNGHTISWNGDSSDTSGNKTILTAQGIGAELTIENATIKDAVKYGIQAYNGGKVTVNNVLIENCGYGAVLVNGGELTIKGLTFGQNGNDTGIEIGSGENVSNPSKVELDGTINSTDPNAKYLYVDENDFSEETKTFELSSTDNSEYKFQSKGNQIVIVNSAGNIVGISNNLDTVQVPSNISTYVEPVAPTPVDQPKEEANPNTSDINLYVLLSLIAASFCGIAYTVKRRFN